MVSPASAQSSPTVSADATIPVGRRRKLVGRSPHDAILIDSDSDHEERHLSKKSKRAIETPKGDVRSEDTVSAMDFSRHTSN